MNFRILYFVLISALPVTANAVTFLGNEYKSIGEDPVEYYADYRHHLTKDELAEMSPEQQNELPNIMVVSGDIDGDGDKDVFVTDTKRENAKAGYFWVPFINNSEVGEYYTWAVKYGNDAGQEWYKLDVDFSVNFRPDTFYIGYDDRLGGYGLVTTVSGLGEVDVYGYVLQQSDENQKGFILRSIGRYSSRITVDEPHPELQSYMRKFDDRGDGVEFYGVQVAEYWKEKWKEDSENDGLSHDEEPGITLDDTNTQDRARALNHASANQGAGDKITQNLNISGRSKEVASHANENRLSSLVIWAVILFLGMVLWAYFYVRRKRN